MKRTLVTNPSVFFSFIFPCYLKIKVETISVSKFKIDYNERNASAKGPDVLQEKKKKRKQRKKKKRILERRISEEKRVSTLIFFNDINHVFQSDVFHYRRI
ncbi:hypothetical protein PUN28_015169 [Cardiocondyla obscurior]|uniref:Uncharacterized protein n=1 Tax=Cardiocondyla obscurior TaxID=286306 RepID=A0AAW2F124_9HYME